MTVVGLPKFPPGVTYLDARVDVGDLQVILPPGVALRGYGEARAGHVNLLGAEDDGWNADVDLGDIRRERIALPLLRDERPELVEREWRRLVAERAGLAEDSTAEGGAPDGFDVAPDDVAPDDVADQAGRAAVR